MFLTPSGWAHCTLPTVGPSLTPLRLPAVMFWRSQTGIVYKEPAESCKDSPVRCNGVVDCSQRSDELGCGEAVGTGRWHGEGQPLGAEDL